jgi:signal transduction histidine kinase
VVVAVDKTLDWKREEMLNKQTKRIREIVAIQSHEVRKPVANIIGLIGMIKEMGSKEDVDDFLNLVEECALELDSIIHRIVEKTYD